MALGLSPSPLVRTSAVFWLFSIHLIHFTSNKHSGAGVRITKELIPSFQVSVLPYFMLACGPVYTRCGFNKKPGMDR